MMLVVVVVVRMVLMMARKETICHLVKYCQDNIQRADVDGTKFFFHQGPFRFSFKTLWAFTGPG